MKEIVLQPYICYRYESKILNGKTFIFNLDNSKIYLGDAKVCDILEYIEINSPTIGIMEERFREVNINNFVKDMVKKGVLQYENSNQ